MQHEHPPIINSENYRALRSAVFGTEIATLLPEHAAMFSAENDACFTHFVGDLQGELRDDCTRAENGDPTAIFSIGEAYHDYRDQFESELAQNNPDAYNEFIEAVASGNTEIASTIVDDFFQAKIIAHSPLIDDELDTQFT